MSKTRVELIKEHVQKVNGKELLDNMAGYINDGSFEFCNRDIRRVVNPGVAFSNDANLWDYLDEDEIKEQEVLEFIDNSPNGKLNYHPTVYINLDAESKSVQDIVCCYGDYASYILALSDKEIDNLSEDWLKNHKCMIVSENDFAEFSKQINSRVLFYEKYEVDKSKRIKGESQRIKGDGSRPFPDIDVTDNTDKQYE